MTSGVSDVGASAFLDSPTTNKMETNENKLLPLEDFLASISARSDGSSWSPSSWPCLMSKQGGGFGVPTSINPSGSVAPGVTESSLITLDAGLGSGGGGVAVSCASTSDSDAWCDIGIRIYVKIIYRL